MSSQTKNRFNDFFSTHLESVQKVVEYVLRILKSCWTSLDKGLKYHKMKVCREIFVTFCVLHSMMLNEMVCEASPSWLHCGCHLAKNDDMWLEGLSQPCAPVPVDASLKLLKLDFYHCRTLQSHHLRV
jgi:hypothetical protein